MAPSCSLSPQEKLQRYLELERRLAKDPEPFTISEHLVEDRTARLQRWLKGMGYDVDLTVRRLHEHARWWKVYGMDNFRPEDELDETGPIFVCGQDVRGVPTLVARPCVHFPPNKEYSIQAARRCVFTVARCYQRLLPGGPEGVKTIFDAGGVCAQNCDLLFARELVGVLKDHFPERNNTVLVVNNHWTTTVFWKAISALLDSTTKAKILFLGSDNLEESAKDHLPANHPYLRYLAEQRAQPSRKVPLPPRLDFFTLQPKRSLSLLKACSLRDSFGSRSTRISECDLRSQSSSSASPASVSFKQVDNQVEDNYNEEDKWDWQSAVGSLAVADCQPSRPLRSFQRAATRPCLDPMDEAQEPWDWQSPAASLAVPQLRPKSSLSIRDLPRQTGAQVRPAAETSSTAWTYSFGQLLGCECLSRQGDERSGH